MTGTNLVSNLEISCEYLYLIALRRPTIFLYILYNATNCAKLYLRFTYVQSLRKANHSRDSRHYT